MVAKGARFGSFQSGKNKGRTFYEIAGHREVLGSGGRKDPYKIQRRANALAATQAQRNREARTLAELQRGIG